MKKFKWKIYENVISKIFKEQIENECCISQNEGWYEMNRLIDEKLDYWEHIYPKKLMNQSYKILFDFKKLVLPF